MRIGIYLTCQGKFLSAIRNHLPKGTELFYEENWLMFSENRMPTNEWQDLDYFIYQPIEDPSKPQYADSHILNNCVSHTATRIRVPYIMFTGITPWRQFGDVAALGTEHRNLWLDRALSGESNIDNAINSVTWRGGPDIRSNAEDSLHQLRKKEANCDISGIADWIESRFQKEHLFWTPNHPRGALALMFCNKILSTMGLSGAPPEATPILDTVLDVERTPLLPGVASSLNLKYRDNVAFFKNDRVRSVNSYLQEYARRLTHTLAKAS